MDAKDELMELLGLDIKVGDRLRRINLPDGWPQQELVVHALKEQQGQPSALCSCSPPAGLAHTVVIFLHNIGVLYERVSSCEHGKTKENHPDPSRAERGER
jgi:hypothetical protein